MICLSRERQHCQTIPNSSLPLRNNQASPERLATGIAADSLSSENDRRFEWIAKRSFLSHASQIFRAPLNRMVIPFQFPNEEPAPMWGPKIVGRVGNKALVERCPHGITGASDNVSRCMASGSDLVVKPGRARRFSSNVQI
jgi:hypothetical protein